MFLYLANWISDYVAPSPQLFPFVRSSISKLSQFQKEHMHSFLFEYILSLSLFLSFTYPYTSKRNSFRSAAVKSAKSFKMKTTFHKFLRIQGELNELVNNPTYDVTEGMAKLKFYDATIIYPRSGLYEQYSNLVRIRLKRRLSAPMYILDSSSFPKINIEVGIRIRSSLLPR